MDEPHTIALLADLHRQNTRQGPGSTQATLQALALSGIDPSTSLRIADIGCGTGVASIDLATHTRAHITAVDFLPAFLETLNQRAEAAGCAESITTVKADMMELPFEDNQFDVIWAEGAIYNIGFEKGVCEWKRFLKPGGVMVLSEITWLCSDVPQELREHWEHEYPDIAPASEKIAVLENNGFSPAAYFYLREECWLDEYYTPLQAGFEEFLTRHNRSTEALAIIKAEEREIALYKKYAEYYSYGVYIARRQG